MKKEANLKSNKEKEDLISNISIRQKYVKDLLLLFAPALIIAIVGGFIKYLIFIN